jgi:membrane protein
MIPAGSLDRVPLPLRHPVAFALSVWRAFRANQGLLLAGAIAYYTLLSLVPLLILMVIALSHFIDRADLLVTVGRALEWVAPGQSHSVVQELDSFLAGRATVSWLLLGTMVMFSSLAFTALENAMSVIFTHRLQTRKRHFLVSALIPFGYIFFLGVALLLGTGITAILGAIGQESIVIFGNPWSLGGISGLLLYAIGVVLEVLLIASIYMVMPVGRLSLTHAVIGGATAALLWEGIRHGLVWYFGTISKVSLVYGSLTGAIFVLLSFEIAAALLLIGAQVIAEYERQKKLNGKR